MRRSNGAWGRFSGKRPTFSRVGVAALVATGVLGATGFAWAHNDAGDANVIHACVSRSSGVVRVPTDGACRSGETALDWNIEGRPGLNGRDGMDGVDGVDGAAGVNGTNGADGADGADGLHCWDANGNGIVDTGEDVTGDGKVDVADCRGAAGTASVVRVVESKAGLTRTYQQPIWGPRDDDCGGCTGSQVIGYRTITSPTSTTVTASCPTDHILIDGFGTGGDELDSEAVVTNGLRTGWTYTGNAHSNQTVTATAICIYAPLTTS